MLNAKPVKPAFIKEIVAFFALLCVAALIAVEPAYQLAAVNGARLFFFGLFPALFPYLFLTFAISRLSAANTVFSKTAPLLRVFGVGENCAGAVFIGLLSGFPVGAKTISDLRIAKKAGEAESVRAGILCSCSSPVFLIGCVGNLAFNDALFGIRLYAVHMISHFLTAFAFSFYRRKERPQKPAPEFFEKTDLLYDGVTSSVNSALLVGGIIILFSVFAAVLKGTGIMDLIARPLYPILGTEGAQGFITGLTESANGIKLLAARPKDGLTLPLLSAVCGFGGISVIAQCSAFFKKAEIKTAPFLCSRIVAGVISFCLALFIGAVFP